MKRKIFLSFLGAASLVGCSGPDGGNEAADANILVQTNETVTSNAVDNTAQDQANRATQPSNSGPSATTAPPPPPPPTPVSSTPPPEGPGAKRPSTPPPQPKGEPDPHAGHDIGNMANMQR